MHKIQATDTWAKTAGKHKTGKITIKAEKSQTHENRKRMLERCCEKIIGSKKQ